MENLIKLIDSLAWPITTIIIGFLFRKELRQVFLRINKLKYKDLEATFDKELTKIESRKPDLIDAPTDNTTTIQDKFYDNYSRLLELSDVSPRAAISEAWRELELSTQKLITSKSYPINNAQISKAFRDLLNDNDYPSAIYDTFTDLRKLRNKAVHASDFDVSQSESERYISTALDLASVVERLIDKSTN